MKKKITSIIVLGVCVGIILGLTSSTVAVENSYASTSYIQISSASFSGISYDSSDKGITVQTGQSIQGTIDINLYNSGPSSAVYVIGATPTWGTHSTSYQSVGTFGTGSDSDTVSVSLTAPSTTGTYYFIIAGQWEFDAGQVISGTNWAVGALHWDDSNDVAGWSSTQIATARSDGLTTGQVETTTGLKDFYYPANALKITVTSSSSSSGDEDNSSNIMNYWWIFVIVGIAIVGVIAVILMRKSTKPKGSREWSNAPRPQYSQQPYEQQYPQQQPPQQYPPQYPPPPPPTSP